MSESIDKVLIEHRKQSSREFKLLLLGGLCFVVIHYRNLIHILLKFINIFSQDLEAPVNPHF